MDLTKLYTEKRIPLCLRNTIYEKYISTIAEELYSYRIGILEEKSNFFNIDTMTEERLIAVSETFGVPFSASVFDDIDFLREEVKNLGFKLFYKGTPTLYKSFFPSVERLGEMFIYSYLSFSNTLSRSVNSPLELALTTPPELPFRVTSKNDFSGVVENFVRLDTGLLLDSTPVWSLDTSDSEISSNHIGMEYFIDRIITREGIEYLMTTEYLLYLAQNMEFARRCKEVPHIGSQLSIQTDSSGLKDGLFPGQEYSVPSLKLNVAAVSNFFSLVENQFSLSFMKFGIGKKELPSSSSPTSFPEDLEQPVATTYLITKDTYENDYYIGATCEYIGQEIKNLKIKEDFDGVTQSFHTILPLAPIRKGNVKLSFLPPDSKDPILETEDDRKGAFSSRHASGTINYLTGECFLTTKFEYTSLQKILRATSENPENKTIWTWVFEKEEGVPINPGTVSLTVTFGEGDLSETFTVKDNGEGSFISTKQGALIVSSINYETGEVEIRFNEEILQDSISSTLKWDVDWVPEVGTQLRADYFFVQDTVNITEVGIFTEDEILVAYATFPPLEFSSVEFHSNITILVKKP